MAPRQKKHRQQHFLVVTYPAQGHINPSLNLAKHLARTTGSLVTFFTSVSGHRLIFPSADDHPVSDGLISYVPFSDGYDDGDRHNPAQFLSNFKAVGSSKLAALARRLSSDGRPVTCIIYGFLLSWAADVARDLSIPSVLYWIQPATVFSIYYHYFHGYDSAISAHVKDLDFPVQLPGVPPELSVRDLPSFFRDDPYSPVLHIFKELFATLDREQPPRVLINTFTALETDALSTVGAHELDLIPVGPLLPPSLFEDAGGGENGYMEWLDAKEERSVVYVSFGSISVVSKRQVEEMVRGLQEWGRPYLWVLREDSRWKGVELVKEGDDGGMVVEWCSQVKVLSHKAVGCFVTHCGWNSTVESLVCGVPTVGVPQWADQGTNARLTEVAWGTGVRVEVGGDGVLQAEELVRCLGRVMAEGEEGEEMRRMSGMWRERALEAIRDGGSSNRNLKGFVEDMEDERGVR